MKNPARKNCFKVAKNDNSPHIQFFSVDQYNSWLSGQGRSQ